MGFLGGTLVKNPPANLGKAGHVVQSLGQKDLMEKEMATHPSIWEIPWTEEPGSLQSMGSQKRDMTEWLDNNN